MTTTSTAIQRSELRLRFNKPQKYAFRHIKPGNTVVLPWGRGVGKSAFLLFVAFILVAMHDHKWRDGMPHPGVRIVFLMPALSQARGAIVLLFVNMLVGNWRFLGGKWDKQKLTCQFPGGSYLHFVSQEQREFLRSRRADVLLVDEADDIRKAVYNNTISPWLSEPFSLAIRIAGGTPMLGRKGLLYELYDLAQAGFPRHFGRRASGHDVPQVGADFLAGERAKAERNGTLAAYKREYECDFDSAEGLVFPMFCNMHVADPWAEVVPTEVIIGVDHGWEDAGVFAIGLVYGSGQEAIVHFDEEVYASHQVETWWVDKARSIKARYPNARWYADPSRPDRIEALRRHAGIKIVGGENARDDGISAVADRFAIRIGGNDKPYVRLKISPRCTNGLKEVGSYRYKRDPRNPERHMDVVDDRDDHFCDAIRYAIFSRFGKPLPQRSDHSNYQFG